MEAWEQFVAKLTKVECLRLARDHAIEEWGTDIPTTLLFAELGRRIADEFDIFSAKELSHIFNIIEFGMGDENVHLKTSVATGLLEALHTRASGNTDLLKRVSLHLGEISRRYLTDWEMWRSS